MVDAMIFAVIGLCCLGFPLFLYFRKRAADTLARFPGQPPMQRIAVVLRAAAVICLLAAPAAGALLGWAIDASGRNSVSTK